MANSYSVAVITREIAQKVRDTVDVGLSHGLGHDKPGEMCVEAAVCYALGLPHGDDPGCVAQPLRNLKIRLNDAAWSSKAARAAGLRRLAVAQLGSAGVLDETKFVRRVVDVTIRKAVPVGLRAAARVNPKHAKALDAAAVRCEKESSREALRAARVATAAADAAATAAAYAATAAADAATAAAYAADAATAAAYAATAAAYAAAADAATAAADDATTAAYAAATAAAYATTAAYAAATAAADAATAAADARTRDRALAEYAEWIVEILIDMKAPGCEWLDLVPLEEVSL